MHPSRESHNSHSVPLGTANGPLVQTAEVNFICSQCGSFYEVAKAKALSDAIERRITCPTCCGPLPAHEAQFTLKYFFRHRRAETRGRTDETPKAEGRL